MGDGSHDAVLDHAACERDGRTPASRHPANLAVHPNHDDRSSNAGAPTSADGRRSDDAAPPRPSGVGGELPPTTVAGDGTPGAGDVSCVGKAGPCADESRRPRDASHGPLVGAAVAPASATAQRN
jgi:hypothetical protein